jgi:hypothetical protein
VALNWLFPYSLITARSVVTCRLDYAVNTVGYERMTAALLAVENPEAAAAAAAAASRLAGAPPPVGFVLRPFLLGPMTRPDTFPVRLSPPVGLDICTAPLPAWTRESLVF